MYLSWVNTAARTLRFLISSADIERLVFTPRYELLLRGIADLDGQHGARILNELLSIEMEEREAAFAEALHDFDEVTRRWSRPGVFIVADTSVFITHEDKLEELDFAPLIGVRDEAIHLLVPIVVVDELDGLKNRGPSPWVKWRAGSTLAYFDKIFQDGRGPARLRARDFPALDSGATPRGEVTAEIVFDPPRHVRLPIVDDEIIDRILATEPLADRRVTLVTYDTNQSTRARAAGLIVKKIPQPVGPEPARAR
jgi:hypothetical protein